ncbi:YecA family protein [Aestuariirhabdus sp. Z084]|uniref:YecA/YgfB family protein n=1 Tax=Aestuariirhabdus haliotis TaxID=2918751 RepID=UPI00201B3801|nr:YecA family protein [Aestuariirhabdus haliotis]MCL6415752.1 YecA family protein [Aestuariirhabdus haliotis]MCL6419669.1 YecA family protein [Aestuariirhabdus haliotis]
MTQDTPFSAKLEQYFNSDQLPEDALELMESHGFLTALNIAPNTIPENQWITELFGGDIPDSARPEGICDALVELKDAIHRTLYSDSDLLLPCQFDSEEELFDSDLSAWCVGFAAALFLDEESWYERDEQLASELLLPVLVLSGLFTEESEEFAEMASDPQLITDMAQQLPQVLTELYLLYQAPEEKPGYSKAGGNAKGGKRPAKKQPGKR